MTLFSQYIRNAVNRRQERRISRILRLLLVHENLVFMTSKPTVVPVPLINIFEHVGYLKLFYKICLAAKTFYRFFCLIAVKKHDARNFSAQIYFEYNREHMQK